MIVPGCVWQAVIEIQRRLPNARVLYVSATGATESSNLGYMQRLGLWGPGTAFASRQSFVSLLTTRGVGAPQNPLIHPIRYAAKRSSWISPEFEAHMRGCNRLS